MGKDIKKQDNESMANRAIIKKNILTLLEKKNLEYGNRIALDTKTNYGWKEFSYKGLGRY